LSVRDGIGAAEKGWTCVVCMDSEDSPSLRSTEGSSSVTSKTEHKVHPGCRLSRPPRALRCRCYHKCIALYTSDVAGCIKQDKALPFPMQGLGEPLAHAVVACRRLRLDGVPCGKRPVPAQRAQLRRTISKRTVHLAGLRLRASGRTILVSRDVSTCLSLEQKDTNNMGSAEPSCLHFATVCGKE